MDRSKTKLARQQSGSESRGVDEPGRRKPRAIGSANCCDLLAVALDSNNLVSNQGNAALHHLFLKFFVHARAIHVQRAQFNVERRSRKPGNRNVIFRIAVRQFQDYVPFPRGHLLGDNVFHRKTEGLQEVGTGPVQRLADGPARSFGWLDANHFQACLRKMQRGCLSCQASADYGYITGCGWPLIGHKSLGDARKGFREARMDPDLGKRIIAVRTQP